jgi:hypothetical protein
VPAGGVITSWSHRANSATGRELGLRVFRPLGGTNYTLVGGSGVQVLSADVSNTFQTRIPVQAGDLLGLYVGNPGSGGIFDFGGGASCAYSGVSASVNYRLGINPEPAAGATVDLVGFSPGTLLNVTATVEADADGDSYGDETQDGCSSQSAVQGACPTTTPETNPSPTSPSPPADRTPPKGKISSSTDSVRDGAVSVKVVSSEAGTATVSGTINVGNASKVYRLKTKRVTLKPNVPRTVKLKLTKKARRAVYKFLRRGRKLKANVQFVVKDRAGNTAKTRRKVKLRL